MQFYISTYYLALTYLLILGFKINIYIWMQELWYINRLNILHKSLFWTKLSIKFNLSIISFNRVFKLFEQITKSSFSPEELKSKILRGYCGGQLYPVFKLHWRRPGPISSLICTNSVRKGQAQYPI